MTLRFYKLDIIIKGCSVILSALGLQPAFGVLIASQWFKYESE